MGVAELGKRYERLLVSSAPLIIAASFLLIVTLASNSKEGRSLARCYDLAANILEKDHQKFQDYWDTGRSLAELNKDSEKYNLPKVDLYDIYGSHLAMSWMMPSIEQGCGALDKEIKASSSTAPDSLLTKWRSKATSLRAAPLETHGVSIEGSTETNVLGTKIRIKIETVVLALQIAIGPLLLLWTGSLYNTRYRETLAISRARDLTVIFPHLVNLYPNGHVPAPRKRVRLALLVPPRMMFATLYTLLRMTLVAFILSPTVLFYLASLWLSMDEDFQWWKAAIGVVVLIFSAALLLLEAVPWHAGKIFPTDQ